MVPPQYANIVQNAMRQPASEQSSGTYDPSFDLSDHLDANRQQRERRGCPPPRCCFRAELERRHGYDASMAAAEQENDAANAAALQTEINAGM